MHCMEHPSTFLAQLGSLGDFQEKHQTRSHFNTIIHPSANNPSALDASTKKKTSWPICSNLSNPFSFRPHACSTLYRKCIHPKCPNPNVPAAMRSPMRLPCWLLPDPKLPDLPGRVAGCQLQHWLRATCKPFFAHIVWEGIYTFTFTCTKEHLTAKV